jgi:hypothetical protein
MSPPSLVQQVWWRDRLDQQHDGVVLMVENFCSTASPMCSREREMWRAVVGPVAEVRRGEGCAPALPYIGGWRPAWPLLQALGPTAKGWSGGQVFPFPLEHSLRVSPWAGRLGLRGLVCLAQVARTLPFRPSLDFVKWAHNVPTLEPSRTFWYNTDKLRNLSKIQKLLSFI